MYLLFDPIVWLILTGLSIWYLWRWKRNPPALADNAATWLRRGAITVLLLGVVGLGVCGGGGTIVGLMSLLATGNRNEDYGVMFLIVGLPGLIVALILGRWLWNVTRPAATGATPPASPSTEPAPTSTTAAPAAPTVGPSPPSDPGAQG